MVGLQVPKRRLDILIRQLHAGQERMPILQKTLSSLLPRNLQHRGFFCKTEFESHKLADVVGRFTRCTSQHDGLDVLRIERLLSIESIQEVHEGIREDSKVAVARFSVWTDAFDEYAKVHIAKQFLVTKPGFEMRVSGCGGRWLFGHRFKLDRGILFYVPHEPEALADSSARKRS